MEKKKKQTRQLFQLFPVVMYNDVWPAVGSTMGNAVPRIVYCYNHASG